MSESELTIKRILVCLDGSEFGQAGVRYAVAIARSTGAELLLLHVLDREGADSQRPVDALDAEVLRVERSAYLESIAKELNAVDVRVRVRLSEGRAADQILQIADQDEVGLIVLASHGRCKATHFFLGATAQKVVQHARQSLFLVRPGPVDSSQLCLECSIKRVLILLDGSQGAESALPAARMIAGKENAEIVIGHAAVHPRLSVCAPPTRRDRELLQELQERNTELTEAYLRRVQGTLENIGSSSHYVVIVTDDLRQGLLLLIEQEQPDMVIMASHGRTSSRHATHGSLTQHLFTYSQRPIWIVQNMSRAPLEEKDFPLDIEHHLFRDVGRRIPPEL